MLQQLALSRELGLIRGGSGDGEWTWAGGSRGGNTILLVLFIVQFFTQPAAHGSDECRPLPAAVLRQQEVDGAVRSQFIHRLLHDLRETRQKRHNVYMHYEKCIHRQLQCDLHSNPMSIKLSLWLLFNAYVTGCFVSSCPDELNSLWVEFVQCPIHSYCDVQVVQASVLPDLIYHGRHSCSAQLSSTMRHDSTHLRNKEILLQS